MQFARHPRVAALFAERGLDFPRRVQWGLARVEFFGPARSLYEPCEDGKSLSFVLPIVESAELIDLAAVDGMTEHVGTRHDISRALGIDAVADARCGDELRLVDRPLAWLCDPVGAVYLFDLDAAPIALDGVAEITCCSIELAERLQALLPPKQRSRVVLDV